MFYLTKYWLETLVVFDAYPRKVPDQIYYTKAASLPAVRISWVSHSSLDLHSRSARVSPMSPLHITFSYEAKWCRLQGTSSGDRLPGSKSLLCHLTSVSLGSLRCLSFHICEMGSDWLAQVSP